MKISLDLHVHSCLSPCGSLEMAPSAIVPAVVAANLSGFALCDHNTARNCPAAATLAAAAGLLFLPGLEVCSTEEAHLLCLYDNLDAALSFSDWVFERLPPMMNIPEKLGDQVVVNEVDEIDDEIERYLGQSIKASINEILAEVHERGGLVIPAHVDKPVFSVISQLGFLDANSYDAVVLSCHAAADSAFDRSLCLSYPVTTGSDAHYLADVGKAWTVLEVETFSIAGIRAALAAGRVTTGSRG